MAGAVRVAFVEAPGSYLRNTFANFRGSFSYTGGIAPSKGRDRVSALLQSPTTYKTRSWVRS
jgi:hypothetical protein